MYNGNTYRSSNSHGHSNNRRPGFARSSNSGEGSTNSGTGRTFSRPGQSSTSGQGRSFSRDSRFGGSRQGGFSRGGAGGYRGRSRNSRSSNRPRFDDFNSAEFVSRQSNVSGIKAQDVSQIETMPIQDLKVNHQIILNLEKLGFKKLTPIQQVAIPLMLEGKEVVGLANTGTGKTAAFLVPLIDKLIEKPATVMIIAPTRELALQINSEFFALSRGTRLRSVVVIGGAPMHRQIYELGQHPNFIIGTPGRLKDMMGRGLIKSEFVKFFVLDEADRMLDMGFIGDIRFLLEHKQPDAKTYFFSATIDKKVSELLKDFSHEPQVISVVTAETAATVKQSITHFTTDDDKLETLANMLKKEEFTKTLIFVRTKYGADKLSRKLSQAGLKADAIHGDKRQSQRERVLRAFRDDYLHHLVATDVAARGLDIKDVSHVINYDQPATKQDYVHRIGRTGRAGKEGHAITFVKR